MSKAVSGAPGDTVLVAPSNYSTSEGEVFPIQVVSGVYLRSQTDAYSTTIVGLGPVFVLSGGNAQTIVEGFTITANSFATYNGAARGGAIQVINGDQSTIQGNLFRSNTVNGAWGTSSSINGQDATGGAIYVAPGCAPLIRNNVFWDNVAGGGRGADTHDPLGGTPGGNGGNAIGGAIYAEGGTIVNNTFAFNRARGDFGGSGATQGGTGGNASSGAVYANGAAVFNNIFFGNGAIPGNATTGGTAGSAQYQSLYSVTGIGVNNNLYYLNQGNSGSNDDSTHSAEPGVVFGNPLLASGLSISGPIDAAIPISSPAAAAGAAIGAPPKDFQRRVRETPPAIGAIEAPLSVVAPEDLEGEGRSDMLWRNNSTGQVYRMAMNGLAITSQGPISTGFDATWKIVADADFNGDGIADLLWRNSTTGQVYVMLMQSDGSPAPGPGGGAVIYAEPNASWHIVAAPDLDGDGRADLLWWNDSTGQVYLVVLDGFSIAKQGFVYQEPNTAWRIESVADFSGSGKQNQLLWRNNGNGSVWMTTVSIVGNSFTQTGQLINQEPNLAWKIVGVGDFDGDGKADIVWRNDNDGWVYVMIMDGPAIYNAAFVYLEKDLNWRIVALGDYDGNGKADFLWRNQSTGRVYMMLMRGFVPLRQTWVYWESDLAWRLLGVTEYRIP